MKEKMFGMMDKYKDCLCASFVAEVVFFLFKTGEAMLEPSIRLFVYRGVCAETFVNDTTCYHLKHYPDQESYVQSLSANYIMYYKILLNLPAILYGLFCGAWSDRIGRKLPIMLPCLGNVLAVLFYMVAAISDMPSLPFVLTGAAIKGGFGKSAVITMAVHSYISDTSSKESRTKRLGRLLAMNYFGYFAGSLLAGAILDIVTFDVIFCIVVFINAFALLITLLFLKESIPEQVQESKLQEDKCTLCTPFTVRNIKESLDVLAKKRENNVRCHIILLFLVVIIQQVCKSGETDITLLFVQRTPLNWPKSWYGYLLAADYASLGLTLMLLLPSLIKLFKINDLTLILVGVAFKTLRSLIFGFVTDQSWLIFTAVVVCSPSAFIVSGGKSYISKLISEVEIGKTFSLLACGEVLSNLLGSVIFTNLYALTFDVHPGTSFFVVAGVFVILFVVLCFLAKDIKASAHYRLLEEMTSPVTYGTDSIAAPLATTPNGSNIAFPFIAHDDNEEVKEKILEDGDDKLIGGQLKTVNEEYAEETSQKSARSVPADEKPLTP